MQTIFSRPFVNLALKLPKPIPTPRPVSYTHLDVYKRQIAAGVRAEAFELSLDRLGFWPQRGILWAGCRQAPAPLRVLAEALAVSVSITCTQPLSGKAKLTQI